jgi:hypothetical protein
VQDENVDLYTSFEYSIDFKHADITLKRKIATNDNYRNKEQIYRVLALSPTLEASLPKV